MINERHQANEECREADDDRSSRELHPFSLVVIGYGNDLRGDDAVGQRVAMAVARWRRPGVMALAAHQLTPELAIRLVRARFAIFVDAARTEGESSSLVFRQIAPSSVQLMSAHTGDPQGLLALTQLVYGRCPSAWSIPIPARHFDFGADLSPMVRCGAAAALRHIRAFIRSEGAHHA